MYIAELNVLTIYQADDGNTYLETYTKEKRFISSLEENSLEVSTGMLHIEGFMLCKADSDVWMQCNGNTYEYVAVYVDDLLCAMNTQEFFLIT